MRIDVRNEPDSGPASDSAVVTYSRLSAPGGPAAAERREPYIDAREVPYRDPELRAYDPERAAGTGIDEAIDDVALPRRDHNRGKRRGGGFGTIVVGALALAAGMVILAYAYGVATRVDGPPVTAGATATDPAGAATIRTTLPADDAARSTPVTGDAPAAAALSPAPGAVVPDEDTTAALPSPEVPAARAEPPTPQAAPREAARAPAAAGSDGVPMDGEFALPGAVGGAPPALVAPVPTTVAPAAPEMAPPPPAKAANAPPADGKPGDARTGGGDDLIANIERLLARDAANGGTAAPGAAQPLGPTPLDLAQPMTLDDPNQLPALPDPNAAAVIVPPAAVGSQPVKRLIPPADIPGAPATGGLDNGLR